MIINYDNITEKDLYLITITKYQKLDYVEQHSLDEVVRYLNVEMKSLVVHDKVYESSGLYKQLHIHAIVSIAKEVRYSDYIYRWFDFKVQYSKIYDLSGAIKYLYKEAKSDLHQENILLYNYFKVYRFID